MSVSQDRPNFEAPDGRRYALYASPVGAVPCEWARVHPVADEQNAPQWMALEQPRDSFRRGNPIQALTTGLNAHFPDGFGDVQALIIAPAARPDDALPIVVLGHNPPFCPFHPRLGDVREYIFYSCPVYTHNRIVLQKVTGVQGSLRRSAPYTIQAYTCSSASTSTSGTRNATHRAFLLAHRVDLLPTQLTDQCCVCNAHLLLSKSAGAKWGRDDETLAQLRECFQPTGVDGADDCVVCGAQMDSSRRFRSFELVVSSQSAFKQRILAETVYLLELAQHRLSSCGAQQPAEVDTRLLRADQLLSGCNAIQYGFARYAEELSARKDIKHTDVLRDIAARFHALADVSLSPEAAIAKAYAIPMHEEVFRF